MTKIRVTGASLPAGFGVQWEYVDSDRDVARKMITFLEGKRVLFGLRHSGDEVECVQSALKIKDKMSELIPLAYEGGGVEQCLRGVRLACNQFATKAGPEARNFRGLEGYADNPFAQALRELSSLVGVQVELLANRYKLAVEEDLLSTFPTPEERDLSWIPGFGENQGCDE